MSGVVVIMIVAGVGVLASWFGAALLLAVVIGRSFARGYERETVALAALEVPVSDVVADTSWLVRPAQPLHDQVEQVRAQG